MSSSTRISGWTRGRIFSRSRVWLLFRCATVGQPGTTGISTVDYFLSSDRLEPPDGQSHYSEQLVRLPDIPHYFGRPRAPDESPGRTGIPLPDEAPWYVCQQTLFKIHPEFDRLMGEILRRDPSGIAVLFEGQVPTWKALLLERLRRSIPDVVDRIVFLPRLPRDKYLRLLTQADVVLDTTHYGAGTTAMHALALGSPLVSLPGEFNRGRVAHALLGKLGISETVATSPADYVERAVRIAQDLHAPQFTPGRKSSSRRCGVLFFQSGTGGTAGSVFRRRGSPTLARVSLMNGYRSA